MSRLAAQAVAQFYPTPAPLIPLFASLVRVDPGAVPTDAWVDPCAGEGEALSGILSAVYGATVRRVDVYAAELEKTRHARAERTVRAVPAVRRSSVLRADALHLRATLKGRYGRNLNGVNALWLNPPYDTDRVFGRSEERFLRRFGPLVAPDGVLLYLLPVTALAASAETLGREWESVELYRLPDPHYAAFRQVLVRARRRLVPLGSPDPGVVDLMHRGDAAPLELPVLGSVAHDAWTLPVLEYAECEWRPGYLDEGGIYATHTPWGVTLGKRTERASAPFPAVGTFGVVRHRYRAAVPPKPAHLAAAVAAGVFDGDLLDPDAGEDLPRIAAKGSFRRVWRTEEEKRDREGRLTGTVEIERPSLEVTILDVTGARYATLEAKPEPSGLSGADAFDKLTTGDLLTRYSHSLADAMHAHCPADFDPADPAQAFPLVETGRPLFDAQRATARAVIVQLGGPGVPIRARRGKVAYLVGEVGCGKSSVLLVSARNAGAKSVLVLIPPHLLDSWRNEVAFAWPEARVVVLDTLADVDALAASAAAPDAPPVVALLTREKAKLGHAWIPVRGRCPACGASVPRDVDLAAKRSRCEALAERPLSRAARLWEALAPALRGHGDPDPATRTAMTWERSARLLFDAFAVRLRPLEIAAEPVPAGTVSGEGSASEGEAPPETESEDFSDEPEADPLDASADDSAGDDGEEAADLRRKATEADQSFDALTPQLLAVAAFAVGTVEARVRAALTILRAQRNGGWQPAEYLRELLTSLPPDAEGLSAVTAEVARLWPKSSWGSDVVGNVAAWRDRLWKGEELPGALALQGGELRYHGVAPGSPEWCARLRRGLRGVAVWAAVPCGEPLFQAYAAPLRIGADVFPETYSAAARRRRKLPEGAELPAPEVPAVAPRRYPLATYIARRHPGLFDLLALDEAHEYSGDGTAQERAAHRLTGLGMPVVLLTGSMMNGYAGHLFGHLWALDPDFRALYARSSRGRFETHYGYRRRYLDAKGDEKPSTRGAVTDRVERKDSKDLGVAPGIQPTAVLRFVLPRAVTLHKADLKLELPPLTVERVTVEPTPEQSARGARMLQVLAQRVKDDAFSDLSGALFGALSEGPSWYDRCTADQGNGPKDGAWEVRYPDTRNVGNALVHRVEPFPASEVLPKEARLLADTAADLAAGRPVMVLAWHLELLPRYARLLSEIPGAKVAVLEAAKVAPSKRQAWIERQIAKGCNVLVTNPVCIQTGLNCLTHFAVQAWMENPGCNAIVYRQAVGRIDRIGQKRPPVVRFYVYAGTVQIGTHALLLRKAAVSQATDGLDPSAALQAAGVGDDGAMDTLSVGRALLALLEDRAEARRWAAA